MPTRQQVLEQFRRWKETSATVRVSFQGLPVTPGSPRPVTANVDGAVFVVDGDDEKALVIVGRNGNNIQMYLTDGCVFQTVASGNEDETNIADMDSIISITFPTGEVCFVTFYHLLN
jgi:hypothetical protein